MPPTSGDRNRNDRRKEEYGALDLLLVRREERGGLTQQEGKGKRGHLECTTNWSKEKGEKLTKYVKRDFIIYVYISHVNICISVPVYVYAVHIYKPKYVCDF